MSMPTPVGGGGCIRRPRRVALVIGQAVHGGGAEKQIAMLAEGLHRILGDDVRLYSNHVRNQYWGEWAAARGVPFRGFESRTRVLRLVDYIKEFRTFRPDVVHGYLPMGGLYGCVAGVLASVPVVLYGERNAELDGARWDRERWLALPVELFAARFGAGVVCNTRTAAASLPRILHLPADRFHAIPNGFPAPEEPTSEAIERARSEIDPDRSESCVLMVGKLSTRKDYPSFLDIAARVLDQAPGARFIAVGEGPLLDEMRKRAAGREFRGRVAFLGARRDVPALLRASQVFLHTGYLEGMSNAVMEASCAGLPVVAVASGGHPEVVVDGVTGLLFARGRTDLAAARVVELLADPDRRRSLGEAGKHRILAEFSVDALVVRHGQLYERLLGSLSPGTANAGS